MKTEYDDELGKNGGRYTRRATLAEDSREFQIRRSRTYLPPLINALRKLSVGRLDEKSEARLWSQVAATFINYQFWQAIDGLVKKQLVDGEIDGVRGLYFENHTLWAQEILGYLVIPYLSR